MGGAAPASWPCEKIEIPPIEMTEKEMVTTNIHFIGVVNLKDSHHD